MWHYNLNVLAPGDEPVYYRPVQALTSQWTPSSGTNNAALVSEAVASDSDFVYANLNNKVDEYSLNPIQQPPANTNLLLKVRLKTSSAFGVKAALYSGTTLIQESSELISVASVDGFTTVTFTISYATWSAVAINWGNLRIKITSQPVTSPYLVVTTSGATETTDGNFKVATFNSSGTFTVNSLGTDPTYGNKVEYLVVAGGGAGCDGFSGFAGGGGGAGGMKISASQTVAAQAYSITVGNGGIGAGSNGGNSSFGAIVTATGGGYGSNLDSPATPSSGGSGGGAGASTGGGAGTGGGGGGATEGNNGGDGYSDVNGYAAGGGGGRGAAGGNGSASRIGGNGGNGLASSITGTSVTYAGGGAGAGTAGNGTGGSGGGGGAGVNGTANLGGGGGGTLSGVPGNGGKGVVIIRWKFQ